MSPNCLRLFYALILFLSIQITVSQTSKIDSLKIELQNHTKKDTIRVNLLNTLAFTYFSKDISKAIQYLDEANSIAKLIKFKKGLARSIYIRGITEAIQANFDQALRYYNEALELYESIGFKKGIANCYNAMGVTYKNAGKLRKSISFIKKAINIEKEIGSDNLSASLINLGSAYTDLGELDKAIPPLKKSLTIAKANGNEQRIAYSLNNLGTIYVDQGNYALAQEYYKQSLYINEKLGDNLGIANHLSNIAWIYKTQKHYDKAMQHYQKALEIHKQNNRKQRVSAMLNDIGTIYQEKNDYNNALNHYVEALRICKQIDAKTDIPHILINIGNIHLVLKNFNTAKEYFTNAERNSVETENKKGLCDAHIGLAKAHMNQKNYNNALNNAIKAKEISKKTGFLEQQKEVSKILSEIYEITKNYKKSLENYQQFKILNDSLFNKKNIEKITQLEYEYKYKQALDSASIRELELKRTVISTNENLEKSQQNLLLGIITFLAITLLLMVIIFFLKLRNEKSKTQNIVIEQKLLRSQMTPHFIFNSLSVLQGLILNKEEKKSVTYLSNFSKLLRTILENSRCKSVVLSEELSAIKSYMSLQNLDVNPPFNFNLTIAPDINQSSLKIPPMLIQPFVENAIEHAFPTKKENKEINIDIRFKNNELICTIEDNGIGITLENQNSNTVKKSLATTITSERLKMLAKDYKTQGSIKVENREKDSKKGTLVTLIIPYKKIDNL